MSYVGVPDAVVTVLAYLHIISAMGWLGGAILFVTTIAPAARKMSPPATLEFLATVVPRVTRFFAMVATSTLIFGLLLVVTIPDYASLLQVGILTGLAAYIVALLTVRIFSKLTKTAKEMIASKQPRPPSAEFLRRLKNGGLASLTVVLLLVVTLMFMVYSGYPF